MFFFFYFSALLTCLIAGPGIKVIIVQIVQGHRVELGGGRLQIDQLIVGRGIVLHARLTRVKAIKKFFYKKIIHVILDQKIIAGNPTFCL